MYLIVATMCSIYTGCDYTDFCDPSDAIPSKYQYNWDQQTWNQWKYITVLNPGIKTLKCYIIGWELTVEIYNVIFS